MKSQRDQRREAHAKLKQLRKELRETLGSTNVTMAQSLVEDVCPSLWDMVELMGVLVQVSRVSYNRGAKGE